MTSSPSSSPPSPAAAGAARADVIVVGAGLAGLSAARALAARGASVRVLEARDRVGGRTLSHALGNGDTVDLGAQWIGPTQDRIAALAREFGLPTFTQHSTGTKLLSLGGVVGTYKKSIPSLPLLSLLSLDRVIRRLEALRVQVPLEAPWTAARAAEWDGMTVETWKRANVGPWRTRGVLDIAVRAVFACEPADLSFLHFLYYMNSGGGLLRLTEINNGAQQTRFATGTQQLALRLAAALGDRVTLGAPVRAIRHGEASDARAEVEVRSDAGTLRARYVIVAIPPALAGRIEYDPPMPAQRDQLTQRMPMGSVIKCIAVYDTPFWRQAGLSGEALSDTGPIKFVVDDSPEDGSHGALLGFMLGDDARAWSDRPADARRAAAIACFARLFGERAARPAEYVDKSWASETWSRGCYAGYFPPGVLTSCGAALRAPVGRIHWAGTETAVAWNGYMDGALESGDRAAAEVLAALGR